MRWFRKVFHEPMLSCGRLSTNQSGSPTSQGFELVSELGERVGCVPCDAYVAMDYHLDWLHVAIIPPKTDIVPHLGSIHGNQDAQSARFPARSISTSCAESD